MRNLLSKQHRSTARWWQGLKRWSLCRYTQCLYFHTRLIQVRFKELSECLPEKEPEPYVTDYWPNNSTHITHRKFGAHLPQNRQSQCWCLFVHRMYQLQPKYSSCEIIWTVYRRATRATCSPSSVNDKVICEDRSLSVIFLDWLLTAASAITYIA